MVKPLGTVRVALFQSVTAWLGSPRVVCACTVGYAAAIVLLTHWPRVPDLGVGSSVLPIDKIIHAGLYAVFGVLASFANRAGMSEPHFSLSVVLIALAVFAAVDELTQSLTSRSPDFMDWAADLAGSGFGIGLAKVADGVMVRLAIRRP